MKKVFVGALVAIVASVSQASVLYWQVDQTDLSGSDYENITIDRVNLYAVNGNDPRQAQKISQGVAGETLSIDVGNYKDYNFYVELINYSQGAAFARSEIGKTGSYKSLAEQGFIVSTLSDTPLAQGAWHASNYGAAPEPTSALLMMMGVAFLGLKRRKA